jgi:hypothetical protein
MPLPPSAADWTRFQKLKRAFTYGTPGADGAIDLINNTDMENVESPTGCKPCSSRPGIRRDLDRIAGADKTRREASKWIDYKAAAQADFVTVKAYPSVNGIGDFGRQLNRTQLCREGVPCVTNVLNSKPGILRSAVYQHSRIL